MREKEPSLQIKKEEKSDKDVGWTAEVINRNLKIRRELIENRVKYLKDRAKPIMRELAGFRKELIDDAGTEEIHNHILKLVLSLEKWADSGQDMHSQADELKEILDKAEGWLEERKVSNQPR